MPNSKHVVMLIEDDPEEVVLFEEVLGQISSRYLLQNAPNGIEGIKQLEKAILDTNIPSLIVLDINMPLMNGREVALKLQDMKELSKVPVAVFTTSDSPADQDYFKNMEIPYFNKPLTIHEYYKKVREMLALCE